MYCDNRRILSHPPVRSRVANALASAAKNVFPGTECLAAVATGAIGHAALAADRLGLPMVYVRPEPKSHGLENRIEGELAPGTKVVVVEDLNGQNFALPPTGIYKSGDVYDYRGKYLPGFARKETPLRASSQTLNRLRTEADRLGVPFADIEAVALSHGHWDHAGGLVAAIEAMAANPGSRLSTKPPPFMCDMTCSRLTAMTF